MAFGHPYETAQLFVLISASLCFGSFLWGALLLFKRPKRRPASMVIVSVCIMLTILCQLAAILGFYVHDPIRLTVASTFYALSFLGFWWAVSAVRGRVMPYAFSPGAPHALVREGPFAWVRHPFYTAYLIAWLAGCIATMQWWLLAPTAVTAWLLMRAAKGEETAFLASPFAEEYRAYQRTTGQLLPRLLRSR